VGAILDEVEDSVEAFFEQLDTQPLRIELDEEFDPGETAVVIPRATLVELESVLEGMAQALSILRDSLDGAPADLQGLVDTLVRETSGWAGRMAAFVRRPDDEGR
jgi:hypothetical protein